MAEEVRWTAEQRDDTLVGISIVRESVGGGVEFGPLDATKEVASAVRKLNEESDAHALARIVAGLVNFSAMLVEHIDSQVEAEPEPEGGTDGDTWSEPRWSKWLREVEKTVRDIPLSD